MIISEKEKYQEFFDWVEENKHNLPDWLDKKMSLKEARTIWLERMETLKMNPDNRTEHEIELDRARIQGTHDAIKLIIDKIRKVENTMQACGYEISHEFTRLKNDLYVMVYKDGYE